jgi:hypothetical protein
MAHGRADILAHQARSGAAGQRTQAAQTTGVAECGKYDRQTKTPLRFTALVEVASHAGRVASSRSRDLRERSGPNELRRASFDAEA